MKREATAGGFIGETLRLLSDGSRETAIYVVIVGGLGALGFVLGLSDPSVLGAGFGFVVDAQDSPASSLFNFVNSIVGLVAGYWLLSQFLAERGRLLPGGSRFWPYLGMTILSALGVVLGFVLLIIPGVILLIRWSAASGYVIGERLGVTESLGKSWEATKGHSWPILGAAVVLFIGVVVAGGIVGAIFGLFGDLAVNVVSSIVEAFFGAVLMAFGIAVFSVVSDGAGNLAETFA